MEVLFYHSAHEKELMKTLMAELKECSKEDIDKFTTIVNSVADFIKR